MTDGRKPAQLGYSTRAVEVRTSRWRGPFVEISSPFIISVCSIGIGIAATIASFCIDNVGLAVIWLLPVGLAAVTVQGIWAFSMTTSQLVAGRSGIADWLFVITLWIFGFGGTVLGLLTTCKIHIW